jgi:hypothetical protein
MVGPLFFLFTTFGEIWIIQPRLLTPHMLGSELALALTYPVVMSLAILSPDSLNTMSHCNIAASIVTNLLSTLLIAYRLWLVNISLRSMMISYS